jgi:hypothetical protein
MKQLVAGIVGVMLATGVLAAVPNTTPAEAELGKDEGGRVIMNWEEFKKVTQWDEKAGDAKPEDTGKFVIPWQEVQDLLDIQIKDVGTAELKLPWKEFKVLLEWSVQESERKKKEEEKKEPVPVPYLVTAADYVAAEINEDGAAFEATFKINVLQEEGWKKIDILPGQVAVSGATLPEGVYLQLAGGTYSLLTKQSGDIEAKVTFSVAVTESGGAYALAFNKLPSGTCVLDVTVPHKDVDIKVAGAQSKLARPVDNGTRAVAALPADAAVSVSWERAVPEAEMVPSKLYSETRTLISVADGLMLGHAQIAFSILHTPTRELTMNVSDGVSVLEVTGTHIRDWRVQDGKLTVQLDREVIGSALVSVKYETSADAGAGKGSIPVVTGAGVEREKGHIAVVALSNVEIKSDKVTGAHLVDVRSLPPEILAMTSQPILLGYRYVSPDFEVGLEINKHEDVGVLLTVLDKAHFTIMQTLDGRRLTRAIYNVRNNRNQFLRLQMPEGAEIWSASVAGRATQLAQDQDGRILLPLVRSEGSGGMSAFPVEIVYAESGSKPDDQGRGMARVELPVSTEPIMHLMVELRVPEQGRYSEFDGTLRGVKTFANVGGSAVPVPAADAAQVLQQAFVQKAAAHVRAAGADAIQVQLPLTGEVYRFEKVLVVSDPQWFSYQFKGLER